MFKVCAASLVVLAVCICAVNVQAKMKPGEIFDGKWGNDVRHGPCVTGKH